LKIALVSKMVSRCAFLNRPPNKKMHSSQDAQVPLNKKQKMKNLEATVVNFNPNIILEENLLIEKKEWLKRAYAEKREEDPKIGQFMKDTFGLQRKDLNKI
jgi:hypothetical protein